MEENALEYVSDKQCGKMFYPDSQKFDMEQDFPQSTSAK